MEVLINDEDWNLLQHKFRIIMKKIFETYITWRADDSSTKMLVFTPSDFGIEEYKMFHHKDLLGKWIQQCWKDKYDIKCQVEGFPMAYEMEKEMCIYLLITNKK